MSINIPIIDGWRILSDKYQYILGREEGNRVIHESFHISIEDCVQAFLDKKIRAFDSQSIVGLLKDIKSLQADLSEALQPLQIVVVSQKEHLHPHHTKKAIVQKNSLVKFGKNTIVDAGTDAEGGSDATTD
jgi:hypothetical protein